jgi:DNA-binding MarR family transcriptional regulator
MINSALPKTQEALGQRLSVVHANRSGPALATRLSNGADTAGRVIVHLASLGRLGSGEVARRGYTQRGVSEALGIQQGTAAKVLSRLQAADVVRADLRHVTGEPRRLKVYTLTALGESVAQDVRLRARSAPPVRVDIVRPPRS